MTAAEERRLRRELEAARELAGHQLAKIRRLEGQVASLELKLQKCRATVSELVAPVPTEWQG